MIGLWFIYLLSPYKAKTTVKTYRGGFGMPKLKPAKYGNAGCNHDLYVYVCER